MENNELKIYYVEGPDKYLESAIEACLSRFGYRFSASGYNMETKVRELAFEQMRECVEGCPNCSPEHDCNNGEG
jgi:hypothetical protein